MKGTRAIPGLVATMGCTARGGTTLEAPDSPAAGVITSAPPSASDDHRARRIVAGSGGDFHCTDDHYTSFRRITI